MKEELVGMSDINENWVGSVTLHSNTGAKMIIQPLGMTMGSWSSAVREAVNRNDVYINFTTGDGVISTVNLSHWDRFEVNSHRVRSKQTFVLELTDLPTTSKHNKYVEAFYDIMGDRWIGAEELKSWQLVWELVKKERENEQV